MEFFDGGAAVAGAFARIGRDQPFLGALLGPRDVLAAARGDNCGLVVARRGQGSWLYSSGDIGGVRALLARYYGRICPQGAFVPYGLEQTYPGEVGPLLGLVAGRPWLWMRTFSPPPVQLGEEYCGPTAAAELDQVRAVVAAAIPDTHRQPGGEELEWWGFRQDGELLAVCALSRNGRGVNLGGFGTLPQARGRGVGSALLAAVTRSAIAEVGYVHFGVYADNAGALRLYRRLGFTLGAEIQSYVSAR